ncbi:DODA-type extradiol aromatic ring-opening family dioxygenase [Orrella daihaiensis]|uniref:Dioxygenase n=1 Tax=Orrella daihaiensis TaxID=2782176 RepID=A0ABY4AJB1_9BURK|nr:class III extradiol ring-cleavage dioxygenase [Orrella daihaiensis]UOD50274.1 dioxygenase [Orrella daihaiensis]
MSTNPDTAPSLFISHGAPTFADQPGELGYRLGQLGQMLGSARAIVAVSPHWETNGLRVSSHPSPETIHDFYGFPKELYAIQYPAHGSPEVAKLVVDTLASNGLDAGLDPDRGMDHGVWVPLRYLRPLADIPVICVSLPINSTPDQAWHLGQTLAVLRQYGCLVLGTGSLTHNLAEFRGSNTDQVSPYVHEFANWIEDRIKDGDYDSLLHYRELAPHGQRAHPTEEHLLPLFFALGATSKADRFEVISREVRYGMLSMASYCWQ